MTGTTDMTGAHLQDVEVPQWSPVLMTGTTPLARGEIPPMPGRNGAPC